MRRPALPRSTRSPLALLAATFAAILALNAGVLTEPPVWDAAASIFPAALYLYQNGFDLLGLIAQPGYLQAGPNVHSYSIVTHGTALVYLLTGGGPLTFPLLHGIHFLLAAYGLTGFHGLARRLLDQPSALLLLLLVLLFPLFLTQTRYMYLEIPLFVCTVGALRGWIEERLLASVVWSALATVVKEAGCVVGIAVGLLWLLDRGAPKTRLARLALVIAPVAAFVWVHWTFILERADIVMGESTFGPDFLHDAKVSVKRCLRAEYRIYLTQIPDTALLIFSSVAVGFASLRTVWRERVARAAALLVLAFLGFHFAALPSTGMHCSVLPRYYVQILPFSLLLLAWQLERHGGRALLVATLLLGTAYSWINRNGVLYPSEIDRHGPGVNFAETERSGAYRSLLAAERAGLKLLEEIPPHVPIYNELHHQYVVERPLLGYVSRPLPNSSYVIPEFQKRRGDLRQFPPCFVIHYFSPKLGGTVMRKLLAQAHLRPIWHSERIAAVAVGPYRSLLFKVWKEGHDCLPGFRFPPSPGPGAGSGIEEGGGSSRRAPPQDVDPLALSGDQEGSLHAALEAREEGPQRLLVEAGLRGGGARIREPRREPPDQRVPRIREVADRLGDDHPLARGPEHPGHHAVRLGQEVIEAPQHDQVVASRVLGERGQVRLDRRRPLPPEAAQEGGVDVDAAIAHVPPAELVAVERGGAAAQVHHARALLDQVGDRSEPGPVVGSVQGAHDQLVDKGVPVDERGHERAAPPGLGEEGISPFSTVAIAAWGLWARVR
jgi:hypothetical protein